MSAGDPYTESDDDFIRSNAGKLTTREIASHLKRSEHSLIQRAGGLGVSLKMRGKARVRAKLRDEQALIVRCLSDCGYTPTTIHRFLTEKVDISLSSVGAICERRTYINAK